MRWWDVESILPLERHLFGPGAWTPETFWAELAHHETRWYVVALADSGSESESGSESGSDVGMGSDAESGAVIGYAGLLVPGAEADVQTIAVSPAAQGQGVGGALLEALITQAHRRGATTLLLEVRADNPSAIGLYQKRGFERIAIRRRYYQPEDVDAWVMRLRPLPPP